MADSKLRSRLKNALIGSFAILAMGACKVGSDGAVFNDPSSVNPGGPTVIQPTPSPVLNAVYVAGIGATLSGTGALSVPTTNGIISRVINGVGGRASVHSLSFELATRNFAANLSNSTDPTQLNGADMNMLLAYSACVDAGATTFGHINTSKTVAQNQVALVTLGMSIMDSYLAGLASGGAASAQLQTTFNNIVSQSIANGATPQMAYVTVCTAAVTAGSTMLGF